MKVKALVPWFGGKRSLAPDVVRQLGTHTQFFEPFCGSMAVLLAKHPSQKETVCDLHGDLTNLAKVVQSEEYAPRLYDRLQQVLFSEGLLDDARDFLERPFDFDEEGISEQRLTRGYWYFLTSWMGRNGTAGTERIDYQIAVRWTKNGGSPTVRFRNAVDSLPAWHTRLRNVVILRRDAFTILDRFEDVPETAIYADSPYPAETRSKDAAKNGRGGRYQYEFNHESKPLLGVQDDHTRLAEALRAYEHARVVVSSYDCERMRQLYSGWTFIDKTRQKYLHNQNGRGSRPKSAPEYLIVNGKEY